jgi:hypothetical protein
MHIMLRKNTITNFHRRMATSQNARRFYLTLVVAVLLAQNWIAFYLCPTYEAQLAFLLILPLLSTRLAHHLLTRLGKSAFSLAVPVVIAVADVAFTHLLAIPILLVTLSVAALGYRRPHPSGNPEKETPAHNNHLKTNEE